MSEVIIRRQAMIQKVGSVSITDNVVALTGWKWYSEGFLKAWDHLPDGRQLVYGYTIDELKEIASRPAEFEE